MEKYDKTAKSVQIDEMPLPLPDFPYVAYSVCETVSNVTSTTTDRNAGMKLKANYLILLNCIIIIINLLSVKQN